MHLFKFHSEVKKNYNIEMMTTSLSETLQKRLKPITLAKNLKKNHYRVHGLIVKSYKALTEKQISKVVNFRDRFYVYMSS